MALNHKGLADHCLILHQRHLCPELTCFDTFTNTQGATDHFNNTHLKIGAHCSVCKHKKYYDKTGVRKHIQKKGCGGSVVIGPPPGDEDDDSDVNGLSVPSNTLPSAMTMAAYLNEGSAAQFATASLVGHEPPEKVRILDARIVENEIENVTSNRSHLSVDDDVRASVHPSSSTAYGSVFPMVFASGARAINIATQTPPMIFARVTALSTQKLPPVNIRSTTLTEVSSGMGDDGVFTHLDDDIPVPPELVDDLALSDDDDGNDAVFFTTKISARRGFPKGLIGRMIASLKLN